MSKAAVPGIITMNKVRTENFMSILHLYTYTKKF